MKIIDKPRNPPQRTERMSQEIKRHRVTTIYSQRININESKTRRKNLNRLQKSLRYGASKEDNYTVSKCIKYQTKSYRFWEDHANLESGNDSRTKLSRGKDPKRLIQGWCTITIIFVIAMMPLNHTLKKCTARYKLIKLQEKINYLM